MLSIDAEEILAFARLAGIRLTPMGVSFPDICARATVVYASVGLIDMVDEVENLIRYVPLYEKKYEDQTGFNEYQLQALEYGFEGHRNLAVRNGLYNFPEYREGEKLRKMIETSS